MTQGKFSPQNLIPPLHVLPALAAVMILAMLTGTPAQAQTFNVLHIFCGTNGTCPDGITPGSLIQAADGKLYGTTRAGGANFADPCENVFEMGCGTVFSITLDGALTTLYSFCSASDCSDGFGPTGQLVQAVSGDIYGTTLLGGANNNASCLYSGHAFGCGTIFKITPAGVLTTFYSFCSQLNCADGYAPNGPLIQASNGDLYGTTQYGGAGDGRICATGCGTIFKITPAGTLTTLYTFCGASSVINGVCADGAGPSGLMQAANGNLFGTTINGGDRHNFGTLFQMTPSGKYTVLYRFCSQPDCTDGDYPIGALAEANDGDLYGITQGGGAYLSYGGTAFALNPTGHLATLSSFGSCTPLCAYTPSGALTQATDGNLYGMTVDGGESGVGTIFELTPGGTMATLYSFCAQEGVSCPLGMVPDGKLIQATNGGLYGTTQQAEFAYGAGVLFSLNVGLGPFIALQRTFGAVGATVTLLGTDLAGATGVTFNGTPTSFTVNSAGSSIKAAVPTGATTGTVQVVTPNGTLQSNVVFRVEQTPGQP
jgi:uncharacterized repeat protein (TIGR03803 family)